MISLRNMFTQLDNASIRRYLGLNDTTAYPTLYNSGIVPQSAHDDPHVGYSYFTDHMMGTDPYILHSETAGTSITLTRNDNWWNKENFHKNSLGIVDAPETVFFKAITDTQTRILDIKNSFALETYIPLANLSEIMNTTTHVPYINNINVYTYPPLETGVLGFNMNDTFPATWMIQQSNSAAGYNKQYIKDHNLVKYSWKDKNGSTQYASPDNPFTALLFRKAFAYACDYTGYMNTVLDGQYDRLSGIIPQGLFGHQSDLISAGYIPSQNLFLAKQLFQEVDWKGNISISFYSGNVEKQKAFQLLADVIDNLGVGITIDAGEIHYVDCPFSACYTPSEGPMFYLSWAPDYADASDYAVTFFHTGGIYSTEIHYSNPHVDILMDKADRIITNNDTRNQLYRQMKINASGDYPYIYLFQANNVVVINRWVTDWNATSTGNENPMALVTHYQYIGLESYTPNQATTTPELPTNHQTSNYQTSTQTTNRTYKFNSLFVGLTFILAGLTIVIPSTIAILVFKNPKNIRKSKKIAKMKKMLKGRAKEHPTISEETFKQLEKIMHENKNN